MKAFLSAVAAASIGAAALLTGATSASGPVYYVDFTDGRNVIGHGFIFCADSPAEYVLVWGDDTGIPVYYGQENCPPCPPPPFGC